MQELGERDVGLWTGESTEAASQLVEVRFGAAQPAMLQIPALSRDVDREAS
jgi:hypothetical protein